jgi:hypothetical protein
MKILYSCNGTLSLSLTDEMSNVYEAIYVTIEDVQIHAKQNGNGAYSVVASTLNYDTIEMPLTAAEKVSPIDFPITLP